MEMKDDLWDFVFVVFLGWISLVTLLSFHCFGILTTYEDIYLTP